MTFESSIHPPYFSRRAGFSILECIAATAILGSALVAGLTLFGLQEETVAANKATRQALSRDLQALASDLVTVDDMARIFHAHIAGETVQPHELVRLQARAYRDFHFWDNAHYQFCEGMLSEDEWRGIRENLKQLMLYVEAYRDYWDGERSSFSSRFQEEVDRMLSESYSGQGSTVMEALGARAHDTGAAP